jgi:hypothetical protein
MSEQEIGDREEFYLLPPTSYLLLPEREPIFEPRYFRAAR